MSLVTDLFEHYEALVITGELAPHEVPGPRQMESEWRISNGTASEVRRLLMADGLAVSVPTRTRPLGPIRERDMERFWKFVALPDRNGCTKWTGKTNNGGYPGFKLNGRMVGAHRVAYTHMVGLIPEGLELDHNYEAGCRSILCVATAHLEAVTKLENRRRAVAARTRLS